jgi:hypothetical protein
MCGGFKVFDSDMEMAALGRLEVEIRYFPMLATEN